MQHHRREVGLSLQAKVILAIAGVAMFMFTGQILLNASGAPESFPFGPDVPPGMCYSSYTAIHYSIAVLTYQSQAHSLTHSSLHTDTASLLQKCEEYKRCDPSSCPTSIPLTCPQRDCPLPPPCLCPQATCPAEATCPPEKQCDVCKECTVCEEKTNTVSIPPQ